MRMILFLFLISLIPNSLLRGQAVNRFEFDRFSHYRMDDWITYAPATHITSIDVGKDYVYFGTLNGGILRYHLYDKEWDYPFTTSNGLRSNHIRQVVYCRVDDASHNWQSNRVYALTERGIDVFDRAYGYWKQAYTDQMPPYQQPDENDVKFYRENPNFQFPQYYRPSNSELPDFFTDRSYIFRPPDEILDSENRIFQLSDARVTDLFQNLWLGTNGLGVGFSPFGELNMKLTLKSITNIAPRDSYYDIGTHTLWIGGHSLGVEPQGIVSWQLEEDKWQFFESPFYMGMYSHEVNVITGNNRLLFFGTEYGLTLLNKRSGDWKTFTRGEQMESDLVNDLIWDGKRLYIATDEGLNWMDPPYKHVTRPEDRKLSTTPVRKLAKLDSTILMATRDGLFRYVPGKRKIEFFTTASAVMDADLSAVNIDSDGQIWVAGRYGIISYQPQESRWESYPNINHYYYGRLYDIQFTKNHVWFAGEDGLLKYNKKKNDWYLYTTQDGLPSNRVYHIDPDGKELWLSTAGGLTVFRWKRKGRIE